MPNYEDLEGTDIQDAGPFDPDELDIDDQFEMDLDDDLDDDAVGVTAPYMAAVDPEASKGDRSVDPAAADDLDAEDDM